jgi:hypothetical protein
VGGRVSAPGGGEGPPPVCLPGGARAPDARPRPAGYRSETPERVAQELTLQLTLGAMLVATQGDTAQEVGHVYTRAHLLCQQGRDTARLFPAL